MSLEKIKKYLKALKPKKVYIDPSKKYWGWKDGVFGKSLPKTKFKSGFEPKVVFDPPERIDKEPGFWCCGQWIPTNRSTFVDGGWVITKGDKE